ncbi:uncharacterized protein LOC130690002 [Daphnia carinata]|uniref:uncharacterized protein LOC130690002 n=1 Tax=Daphnia carinata TaxID=120202 RepID=UPI0025808639|nr:uncharacterized protein LOC130690002 [Daphnia carinata]XP_057368937.1 uncharacterized protein LOC130690002 [Daphnia carinata]
MGSQTLTACKGCYPLCLRCRFHVRKVVSTADPYCNSMYPKLSSCGPSSRKSSRADPQYYIRRNTTKNVSEVLRRLRPASVTASCIRSEMMSSFYLLLAAVLMAQISRACDGGNEEQLLTQDPRDFYTQAYGYTPETWNVLEYQLATVDSPVDGYSNLYDGRTLNKQQHVVKTLQSTKNDLQSEGRLALGGLGANLINAGFFNNRFTPANTWRPFATLVNRLPVSLSQSFDYRFDMFETCVSPNGESGICAPGSVCSLFGGRPTDSCSFGKVCCINTINKCGGVVTLNNTYWQNPSALINAPSSCSLTVRTDTKLTEQSKRPICQIRLDFISFTIAQPTAGNCIDTFQIGEATTVAPTICGDNSGQHMYIDVPSSAITPSNVQFMFNFAADTASRSWNIKIALLPCGGSYLAPADCLQYFTAATGKVRSFNWLDISGTTTRQLNNQNYNVCFRTELISGLKATQMCLSVCSVRNGDAFSITTPTTTPAAIAAAAVVAAQNALTASTAIQTAALAVLAAAGAGATAAQIQTATDANIAVRNDQASLASAQAAAAVANTNAATLSSIGTSAFINAVNTATCLYDFLLIAGARDANDVAADRYCGNALNPAAPPVATSTQICTPVRPFRISYHTDGTEAAVAAGTNILPAPADTANTGFCFNYEEK